MIKSGIGYDAHQLGEGESLVIGGVKVASKLGSIGHSDGDVLIHALCDALLGSSGKGDMGLYFDSSEKYKNGLKLDHDRLMEYSYWPNQS